MTIGQRVKELRLKKGLTQGELADRLGFRSKSSVAHIELGRDIPRHLVVKLADVLDTTPAYLMGWEDKVTVVQYEDGTKVVIRSTPPTNSEPAISAEALQQLSQEQLLELMTQITQIMQDRQVQSKQKDPIE